MTNDADRRPTLDLNSGKLDAIQLLRAIAALAVVVHHVGLTLTSYYPTPLSSPLMMLSGLGAAGVDLFFVISGYIIFRSTSKLESGPASAKSFLQKRALRIYPTYWIWTSVLLLMWLGGIALKSHQFSPSVIAGSYFLVPVARGDGSLHPILDQGWTRTFEMYFYLVFSLIILLGLRKKNLAWIASPFLLFAIAGLLPTIPENLRGVVSSPLIGEFLLGVCLGWAFSKCPPPVRSIPSIRWGLTAIAIALLVFAALRGEVKGTGIERLLVYGTPSAVLVALALLTPSTQLVRRLTWLGDASYSIYLTHGFFTLALGTVLKRGFTVSETPPAGVVLAIASLAILLISSTAYWLVEKPVTRAITAATRPGSSTVAPQST